MKFKFNWGTGAFVLFSGFAIFMSCLAILASQQSHELVTKDYYEKELEFKEILKKQDRAALLSEQLRLEIENEKLIFYFPSEIKDEIIAEVKFFKPSREKDDEYINFRTDSHSYHLPINHYASGMYKVKIYWASNGVEYYNESQLVIPKFYR